MIKKNILNNNNKNTTLKDLEKIGFSTINTIEDNNIKKGRKSYNFRRKIISPVDNQSKFFPLDKFRIKSPQETQKSTHYSSITYNHFRNKYTFSSRGKNSDINQRKDSDILFSKIKSSLNTQYNISDLNSSYTKNKEKPYFQNNIILQNIQNNRKNTLISLNVSNNNRNLVDEDFHNQRINHKVIISHHTKGKTLQKNKSQEGTNNNNISYIHSKAPSIKNKTVYYDNNIKVNDKNENHNYILYDYKNKNNKNNTKKNYSINNYSINNFIKNNKNSRNNITQNNRNTISIHRDMEEEKNKKVFDKSKYIRNREKKDEDKEEDSKNLLILRDLFKTLSSLKNMDNPFDNFGESKEPIKLSPGIFSCHHSRFRKSICSSESEFKKYDFIKAYAYNTCEGNIRDYNEDTITATKINIYSKDNNNEVYFFGLYDGHGGNGCSLYLKNNLHKNITEFSMKGIKNAIKDTEDYFLENVAVNDFGEIMDSSGSCAIVVLLKNKTCIIANIGDSRCILFKNNKLIFSTRDHKPNSSIEKRRIELAGGSIYQSSSVVSLYQNGKLIEIPWRVQPGRLSVSRTFGDIEAKVEKYGGKKNVVVALPDVVEFELNEEYNFIVMGCDGIFDVLSNQEILECIRIVLKINKNKNKKMNELCGDFAAMIIKSALAKESFDNISCIVIVFNINGLI